MKNGGGGKSATRDAGLGRRQFMATTASLAVVSGMTAVGVGDAAAGLVAGPAKPLAPGWVVRDGWILPVSDL